MGRAYTLDQIPGRALDMVRVIDAIAANYLWVARAVIVLSLAILGYYAADRKPPFEVLEVYPAAARAGEMVTVRARVRRDVHRECSAQYSRSFIGTNGIGADIASGSASAEMLAVVNSMSPDAWAYEFKLPEKAMPGRGGLVNVFNYSCNKVHRVFPIEVTFLAPVTVLP